MIKQIKTGLLTALLSLVALSSHADKLYVEDTQVLAGGECDLNIVFESNDMSQYCAFQFDIVLPEGITWRSDNEKGQYYNDYFNDPEPEFRIVQQPSGVWRVMCYSASNQTMKGQTGRILSLFTKATTSSESTLSGNIQNVVFTKLNANGTTQTVRMNASSYSVHVWKEATVTAKSYTRRYGEPNPTFGYEHTGGSLQGTPQITCDATPNSPVGPYEIKISQGTIRNPYVTYVPGVLTITSASSTLTFDPVSKTYGDAAFTVTPKTNVSDGAITYSSGNTSVVTVSGQTFTIVGAGTAIITANQAATANYGATSTTFTVTVGKREAVLSWSNLSFTYDGQSHVPSAKVTNLVGNDVCNVTVTGAQTNVGSYTATATALSNANYKLPAANTQAFTITSASSTLTFDPVNKTYGDAAFTVTPKTNVSGGAITYNSGNTSVVSVSGQTFTIVGAGTAIITANQAATANYGATSTTFTVTVGKREAVLSWSNLSFTYDGQSHVPTAKVTNLVGNDVCNVTVTGAQINVGSYTATATGLSNANYKLPAANTQAFTITSASSTLTFDPVSKTYGDAAFTVTPKTNVSGGAITYSSGNTSVVTISGQTFTIVGAGTAIITANQAATANYGATSTTFTVTVGKREAVLSWSNLSFTYDGNSHVPTAKVTNLVGNDVCNVIVSGAQTNVGSYTATATALSNANYKLPAANTQAFTITSASSTLTFDPVNKTYGDAAFTVTPKANVSGGAVTYSSGNTSVVSVSGQTFTIVGAGTAIITANQAATANYGATSTTFTVTVGKREAVLSWSNLSFTYDGQSHVPTAKVTNLVGNDVCNVTVTGAQTNVGSYTATATALSNANYKLPAANTQAFTITKAPLIIFAGNYVKKQGDPMPEWKAEYDGFVNNETQSVLTKVPDFYCEANELTAPGQYTVTVSGAEAQNYAITYVKGILTVTQADQIVVIAKNVTREYGDPNPTVWEYEYSGGTLVGEPEIICDARPNSSVGTYPIIVRQGTVSNPNVQFVDGILTISKAPLKIIADSYTIKQGDPIPTFTANYEGFKLGETASALTRQPQFSCSAQDSNEPGEYPIRVYGYEAKNYEITPVDGMLTILEADPIIVTIENCSREYGEPNPAQWKYSVSGGTLDGTPSFTCDARTESPVGTYEIRGTRGTVTNPNVQFVTGYLTINKAPLRIIANSYTIKQGAPMPTFTARYEGFKLGETESVLTKEPQFSCPAFDSSEPGEFPIRVYGYEAQNYAITPVDGLLTIEEDESGYTLVVELNDGRQEMFVLKERPQAWPNDGKLQIATATLSTSYERTDIKECFFLDKDNNPSGIEEAAEKADLTVKQTGRDRLMVSGLDDGERISIYDLSGRLMDTIVAGGSGTTTVDLSQQPKGIYIVNINNKRTIKIQVK